MLDVSVDISDIDRVNRKLKSFSRRFRNLRAPLKESGLYMMREMTDRIDRSGPGWKPLSWVTKLLRPKGRAKKFRSVEDVETIRAKPLADTGRLRASLQHRRVKGNIFKLTRGSLEFGTGVKYAKGAMGLAGPQKFQLPDGWYKRLTKNTTKKFRNESGLYPILKSMEGKSYKIPKRNPVFVSGENRRRIRDIFDNFAFKMMREHFGK